MATPHWGREQGTDRGTKHRGGKKRPGASPNRWMPRLEALEDRLLPSLMPYLVAPITPASMLTNVSGTLFFESDDGMHGRELWRSDGTSAGTTRVADISPGIGKYPTFFANVNGTLFFSANDGVHGSELWRSDGTAGGTAIVADIVPGSGSSNPEFITNVNGTVFFEATDNLNAHDYQLWRSDGTTTGTTRVTDIFPGSNGFGLNPSDFANVNGTLFFQGSGGDGLQLWRSDGTMAGTTRVTDIFPGINGLGLDPVSLTNVNGTLFFTGNDGIHGYELWRSDGTASGTTMVADIFPGRGDSQPYNLTNVSGTLFFSADDGIHGFQLWRSNGTASGTAMVADVNPAGGGTGTGPQELANANGTLFFSAIDRLHGRELWRSDGTSAGTALVADINPGSGSSDPFGLTNVSGKLFFGATDGSHGTELWALQVSVPPKVIPPVLLLNPSAQGALSGTQEGAITIAGGPVVVDSANAAAALAANHATITAPEFDISGVPGAHTSGFGKFVGKVHSGVAPTPDPLASLAVPALPTPSFGAVNYSGTARLTLSPGTYFGGIHVSGDAPVTLLPGIYYLKGGGFSVSGDAKVMGSGVMIYNAPLAATDTITVGHAGEADLTAPTSGTYAGVVVFQDRTSHAPITLTDHGEMELSGIFYAAAAPVSVGDGGELEAAAGSHYIASGLHVTGHGRIQLGIADAASAEAVPAQALVQTVESNALASSSRPGTSSTSGVPALVSRATIANAPVPFGDGAKESSSTQPHLHQRKISTDALDLALAQLEPE